VISSAVYRRPVASEDGILMEEFDRSEEMEEFRKGIIELQRDHPPGRMPTSDEIIRFIERPFDRSY